jgi:GDP-L-fucose synthase
MSKTLLLGGSGFIGREVLPLMKLNGYDVDYPSSNELNLFDDEKTNLFFEDKFYDSVIFSAIVGRKTHLKFNSDELYQNLVMFENVYKHKDKFNLFVNIDSGSSIQKNFKEYSYSFSKYCISKRIENDTNTLNLRVYGCFGPKEEKSKFFVGNILRYINKEPMSINKNIIHDFISSKDLYSIIDWSIKNKNNILKNINCVYNEKYRLTDICDIINTLDQYNVDINVNSFESGLDYYSLEGNIPIKYEGLYNGILDCFQKLKQEI